MKRRHLFKNRQKLMPKFINKSSTTKLALYTPIKTRLEFVYIRIFKKLFRRRFVKAKMRFFKAKYWFFLLPNFILTQKSKNARMGAGVGNFVRLTNIAYPGTTVILTWHYEFRYLQAITSYLTHKIPVKLLVK